MYAIVEIAGRQYRVEENKHLVVNRLQAEAGSTIEFDRVLMVGGDKIKVGAPTVDGATVTATVKEHGKGDKVLVFKKKRRKGYQVKNGHRQYLTKLEILKIDEKAAAKKVPAKKSETKPKPKAASKKSPVKKKTPTKKVASKKAE